MASGVNMIEKQSWSDLPLDIINIIANRLYYIDQVRFRAVCKDWRAANIVRYSDKLPWLMGYDSHACYLFDPSHKRKYTVLNGATILEKFTDDRVLDLKHDWLLFMDKRKDVNGFYSRTVLFFYTPFTGKMIELPEFHLPIIDATFSTTPVSPDCKIFALSVKNKKHCISICRPGDINWTQFQIDGKFDWADNFVYVDGFLYCSFAYPKVIVAFNVASEKWNILQYPPPAFGANHILIESDGNLLICYYKNSISSCRFFKFNRSQMDWFEIESFDDRALFVTSYSCIWVPVEKESELANTIHYSDYFSYEDFSSKYLPKIHGYDSWRTPNLNRFLIQPPRINQ